MFYMCVYTHKSINKQVRTSLYFGLFFNAPVSCIRYLLEYSSKNYYTKVNLKSVPFCFFWTGDSFFYCSDRQRF